jgi:uncharacterized membrane protein
MTKVVQVNFSQQISIQQALRGIKKLRWIGTYFGLLVMLVLFVLFVLIVLLNKVVGVFKLHSFVLEQRKIMFRTNERTDGRTDKVTTSLLKLLIAAKNDIK